MSEQGDQRKERDESEQGGSTPGHGSGDVQVETGNQKEQRQGDVEHEGDLGNESGRPAEDQ